MTYTIPKPAGTTYTDYVVVKGKCYAVFEYEGRVKHTFVCPADRERADTVTEDEQNLYITI